MGQELGHKKRFWPWSFKESIQIQVICQLFIQMHFALWNTKNLSENGSLFLRFIIISRPFGLRISPLISLNATKTSRNKEEVLVKFWQLACVNKEY